MMPHLVHAANRRGAEVRQAAMHRRRGLNVAGFWCSRMMRELDAAHAARRHRVHPVQVGLQKCTALHRQSTSAGSAARDLVRLVGNSGAGGLEELRGRPARGKTFAGFRIAHLLQPLRLVDCGGSSAGLRWRRPRRPTCRPPPSWRRTERSTGQMAVGAAGMSVHVYDHGPGRAAQRRVCHCDAAKQMSRERGAPLLGRLLRCASDLTKLPSP